MQEERLLHNTGKEVGQEKRESEKNSFTQSTLSHVFRLAKAYLIPLRYNAGPASWKNSRLMKHTLS